MFVFLSKPSIVCIGAANFTSEIGSEGVVRSTIELVVVPKNPKVGFSRILNRQLSVYVLQTSTGYVFGKPFSL